jgi:hypothetical protein
MFVLRFFTQHPQEFINGKRPIFASIDVSSGVNIE